MKIADASRLVVKVGSSSLTNSEGGLHAEHLDALVKALSRNVRAGVQLILVSSGSIAAGTPVLGLRKPPRDLATQQAAASVGQGSSSRTTPRNSANTTFASDRCCSPPRI